MISKSGIDSKNFEFASAGEVCESLYMSYTSKVPTGLYILKNINGMEVCITNVGARIVSCMVPDKNNKLIDVILGFDSLEGYIDYNQRHDNVQGALVGRYAGRISNAKFTLRGKEYNLPQNAPGCCLHGGPYGWSYMSFKVIKHTESYLQLFLSSPDGDMGFPGRVDLYVTYSLEPDNSLHITYEGTCSAPTPINVTNHAYWNLSGNHNNTILDDTLFINARLFTPLNDLLCPTGEMKLYKKNGVLDFYGKKFSQATRFKNGKRIGDDIRSDDEQIQVGNGYDHCFVLQDKKQTKKAKLPFYDHMPICAKAYNKNSGVVLEIFTTEPAVQLYDSADLDGSMIGKKGVPLNKWTGLCLETQHFANSPNTASFPSTILYPGDDFKSKSVYKFSKE